MIGSRSDAPRRTNRVYATSAQVLLSFGDFVFDVGPCALSRAGVRLKVDPQLLQLLGYLLANPGRLISKRELLDRVWEGRTVADNVLSVSVAKLRKVLGHQPGVTEYIENTYGRGYRFVAEVAVVAAPRASSDGAPRLAAKSNALLVGRVAPLLRLNAALQRARAGRGGLCLLVGEPGIGKTRLAEAVEESARGVGFAVAWGRCQVDERTPPLWVFTEVFRQLREGGVLEAAEVPGVASGEREPMLDRTRLYDTLQESHGTLDRFVQTLICAAKQRPLLVILDDLQWADAASLRLLRYWIGEASRWPVLVLATQRSCARGAVDSEQREWMRLSAHANCEHIELERLERADIQAYLENLFGQHDGELSAAVFERSEGNPFFMVELLRPWVGVAPPPPDRMRLPGAALELIRQRLRDLPDVSLEVLSAAAVIGQTFDLGLLSHVTGRHADALLEALDDSLANDTIVAAPDLASTYAFDHALLREVLYDDLSVRRRCELHALAGEGLARRREAGGDVACAELAHHFLAALPHGDVGVAVSHAREAAASATLLAAHADARALLRRALASFQFSTMPDPEARTAVLLELSMVERTLADPAYFEHLEQGVALARDLRLGSMLTLAGRFLSPGPGVVAKTHANRVLEAAVEVLPADAHAQRAVALAHLSWTPPASWSARRVETLIAEAESHARASRDREAAAAVQDAAQHFAGLPAVHSEDTPLDIARELSARPSRIALWLKSLYRLFAATQRGDEAGVARVLAEMSALHDRLANAELLWHHERLLLVQRMNRGDWADVGPALEQLRERAQRLRLQAWRSACALDYSLFLLNTSDARVFARNIRPDLAPGPYDSPNMRSMKLRLLAEHDFADDVREQLALLTPELLHDLPHDRDYLGVLSDLATACVAVRSLEHCQVIFELLRPFADYYAIGLSFHCQGSVCRHLGNLCWELGDRARALEYLLRGEEQNRRFRLQACVVHNQLDLAKAWLAPGPERDLTRGRHWLSQAQRLAASLGMTPAQRAATQLASLHAIELGAQG